MPSVNRGCSHWSDLSLEKGPVKLSHFRKSALREGCRSDRRLLALEWPEAPVNISLPCCRLRNAMPSVTGHEALNPRVYCYAGRLSRLGGARRLSAGPVRAFARRPGTKRSSRFSGTPTADAGGAPTPAVRPTETRRSTTIARTSPPTPSTVLLKSGGRMPSAIRAIRRPISDRELWDDPAAAQEQIVG